QVLALGLVGGPVSAFINNTAAVAVMVPLVGRMAKRAKQSVSKLLMPLSFAAMLGGTMTLIGTSTNLLASALKADAGLGPFGMFEFTKAGVIVFGIGLLYLVLVGHRFIPERVASRGIDERYLSRRFVCRASVPAESPLVGKPVGGAALARRFGAKVLSLERGGETVAPAARADR
ncbi:MAG: SLC13 family permease, partial [Vicinamibacteria bacterium]